MTVDISVVIPVYNGESFLEETIKSLQNQSHKNFEVIFVNDSSADSSLSILHAAALLDSRLKVYTKPNGGTVAKAINFALQFCSGEYFMYSSQDDLYSHDLLKNNLDRMLSTKVDAVVPDMVFYWGNHNFAKGLFGINGDRSQIIDGRTALFLSLDWTIHGFVLWKMKTVKNVGYSEFGMNSDEFTTRVLYLNSKLVAFSKGIFYYRQNNTNAITKKWNSNQLDCFDTSSRLKAYLLENNFGKEALKLVDKTILIDLVRIKLMLLKSNATMSRKEKLSVNRAIKQIYNDNFQHIKGIRANSLKEWIMISGVATSYQTFIIYVYFHKLYARIVNGNR